MSKKYKYPAWNNEMSSVTVIYQDNYSVVLFPNRIEVNDYTDDHVNPKTILSVDVLNLVRILQEHEMLLNKVGGEL